MRINGYNDAEVYTGERRTLPAGKYICVIKGAALRTTSTGKAQVALQLDIADGEYMGFFEEDYGRRAARDLSSAKWSNSAVFRQGYEGKSLPFFKGMITAIEKSNPGFVAVDPQTEELDLTRLAGKKVGALFGREQFMGNNGNPLWSTKVVALRSIDSLENEEVPADKPLVGAQSGYQDTQGIGFTDVTEDDLPF